MRVLIAGGTGFLGTNLRRELQSAGHEVRVLTRRALPGPQYIRWNVSADGNWIDSLRQSDAVVNACGYGLDHWPWSAQMRQRFLSSRVDPARVLTRAITDLDRRPGTYVQFSGVNRYGLRGAAPVDEDTPPGQDFPAQLTVHWEAASAPVEAAEVRRIIVRNAVVLHARRGLFPLMSLACRLFFGGRFGDGSQFVPWIHADDHARAIRHLLEDATARGPYNLAAPQLTSNDEFMRAVCRALRRPYWFHVPAWPLRLVLGEMASMILDGRACLPKRLLESGFKFSFPELAPAVQDLFSAGDGSTL